MASDEKITWDKLTQETPMFVIESDGTIVVPLMLMALIECKRTPTGANALTKSLMPRISTTEQSLPGQSLIGSALPTAGDFSTAKSCHLVNNRLSTAISVCPIDMPQAIVAGVAIALSND